MNGVTVFGVGLCAVLVAAFARNRHLNAPLVVLAVGLAASFIPGLAQVEVETELILGVVLPPLLYSAALSSSYQDFRASLRPILKLGVGLVIVTAVVVAVVTSLIEPQFSLPAALLLGAMVGPPDAVSAAAVGRKLGLPRRVMTLLGGESLINDATSLTLYSVALASLRATAAPSWGDTARIFGLAVVVGVGTGLILGAATQFARRKLRDPAVDTVLGVLLPFVAYWLAEVFHGSGVLAVVAAGFLIGHSAPRTTVSTRLHEEPIWSSIDLLLESFTFALIGLQLRWVIVDVDDDPTQPLGRAFLLSGAVLAVTILIRPVYIYLTEAASRVKWPKQRRRRRAGRRLNARELLILSWSGMRGVVTLAAAAALGEGSVHGRTTLQLAAYIVAIGTLLLQGLTLPSIIRRLNVTNKDEAVEDDAEEARTRILTAHAAARVIEDQIEDWATSIGQDRAELLAQRATQAIIAREAAAATLLRRDADDADPDPTELALVQDQSDRWAGADIKEHGAAWTVGVTALRTAMIQAQREVVVAERDAGRLNETVMRRMLRELDLEEESMAASWTNRL